MTKMGKLRGPFSCVIKLLEFALAASELRIINCQIC